MKAIALVLALAATAAYAQTTPLTPTAEEVLKSALIQARGTGEPKLTYDNLNDFGNAFKASVFPLVPKADDETPPIPVHPWYPLAGYKLALTWRDGTSKLFTGEELFQKVGKDVYGVQAGLDSPIAGADASQGTYRDYYGGRFNHLQPGIPSSYAQALPDRKLTSASIQTVLDQFPWGHPSDSSHAVTALEFQKLKREWYGILKRHTTVPYTSLILPFTSVKGLGGGTDVLMPMDRLIANYQDVKNGAPPRITLANFADIQETPGGQSRFKFAGSSDFFTFKLNYTYYFQNAPSKLDIDQNGGVGGAATSYRNAANDFEGPMALFSGGAISSGPANGENVIHEKMNFAAGAEPNLTWLETLADTELPAAAKAALFKTGYQQADIADATERAGASKYFARVSTGDFTLHKRDLEALNTDPKTSKLTVTHAAAPTLAFNPQHFADEGPTQMEDYLRTASPAVAAKKMRQGAMQVYVVATAEVYRSNLVEDNPGTLVAKYKVVDDAYVMTPFVRDQFQTVEELNRALMTSALRGGTYVKDGDPYDRVPDFDRINIPTPARADTRITDALPSDRFQAGFPDPRHADGRTFLDSVKGKEGPPVAGDPTSLGDAFFEAHVGRGPAYNYVYDRDGAGIDPTRPEPPQKYWPNPRHVAIIFPYIVKLDGGGETTVGPYILNLNECQKAAQANAGAEKYTYTYAQPPWHDNANQDIDKCTPIVLSDNLRVVINKLYENAGTREVHMTADASDKWGVPQLPGNMPDYRWAADLSIVDANKEAVNSLILRVPCSDKDHNVLPIPGNFVPVLPAFPTFQGKLKDDMRPIIDPALTALPAGWATGTPPRAERYFVAAYDARLRTSGGDVTQSVPVPGLPAEARTILSKNSVDMSVKAQVVDGCGRITTLKAAKVAGIPLFRPSASITFLPSDDPAAAYTVGVPIAAKYFIPGNESARPFTTPNPLSLGGRINDLNRPFLAGNLSPEFDGTEPPGSDKNPGDEFFRPPEGGRQRVVKGRSVRMEIMAESQVPPGFNLYDTDNPPNGDRARYKARPYASFIRKMDISIFPPGPNGRAADVPEKKANLFFFNSASDMSATVAPPPMATFEYVFREATSAAPTAKGKVPDSDRYYLVRLDVEDIAGNTRSLKFPVWVSDEGLQTDKLSTEHQRK